MRNYFDRTIRKAILIGLVALAGCDKDDPTPFKAENLTSGTGKWKLSALTLTVRGQTEDALDDCLIDDILYFIDDGTYQLQLGVDKCDASEVDESGTWKIHSKQLIMEAYGEEPEAVIIKLLNETTFKTSLELDIFGEPSTITATYTKQ